MTAQQKERFVDFLAEALRKSGCRNSYRFNSEDGNAFLTVEETNINLSELARLIMAYDLAVKIAMEVAQK